MTNGTPPRPASYDKKVGLVLQGGGALGSYQAGVYEALASSEYQPDWVAGISIGGINAAIIAGNVPEHRVQALRNFWHAITATTKMWPSAPAGPLAEWQNRASALTTVMFGQPGFFTPRPPQDWFSPDNCDLPISLPARNHSAHQKIGSWWRQSRRECPNVQCSACSRQALPVPPAQGPRCRSHRLHPL